jgi:hypothetical protein
VKAPIDRKVTKHFRLPEWLVCAIQIEAALQRTKSYVLVERLLTAGMSEEAVVQAHAACNSAEPTTIPA